MELDPLGDMFGEPTAAAAAVPARPAPPTFYIDESDSAKKEEVSAETEAGAAVTGAEEGGKETPQPQQKLSFWSRWSRPKSEAGSKENILEDTDKKPGEEGESSTTCLFTRLASVAWSQQGF